MANTAAEVQKAYLAYFGRPADTAGLAYWQTGDAATMKTGFAASAEYAALYSGMSADQRVEQVYQNLLGRASDATGKAYWVAEFNAGRETVSSLVASMQIHALGSDVSTIANRVSYASDFTAALDTPAKIAGYAGTGATNAARSAVSAVHADATSLSTAKSALTTTVTTVVAASTTHGLLADGYIKDATVFADANGDGVWNPGEAKATTDANGNFSLHGGTGKIIASGGTDISTNLPFGGMLSAPDGASVINPLTTLVQSMVESGTPLAQAQSQVLTALGLPATVNLQTLDPISVALGTGSSADKAVAAQVQAAAAKVANILVQGMSAMQGAGSDISASAAMSKMATAMASSFSSATAAVDLTQTATLKTMMTAATSGTSAAAKIGTSIDNLASLMSSGASKIDAAMKDNPSDITAALSQIAKVQVVAQGTMADSMKSGMTAGDLAGTLSHFSGSAFDDAVNTAVAGNLTENIAATTTHTTIPTTGGGGGGGNPSAPFTVTETQVTEFDGYVWGDVTFSGGSGDITLSWSDGPWSVATFSRGGSVATVKPDFDNTASQITLAAGQTLTATAANLNDMSVDGAGTVVITDLGSVVGNLWLGSIQAVHVTIDSVGDVTLPRNTQFSSTTTVAVSSGTLDVSAARYGFNGTSFAVAADATLVDTAGRLDGATVTGSGTVNTSVDSGIDLSHLSNSLTVNGVVTVSGNSGHVYLTGNPNLGSVDTFIVNGSWGWPGLELSAAQANGKPITGTGDVMVDGSDGAQTLNIATTGNNYITPGGGADQVTLGNGTDMVVINGGVNGPTSYANNQPADTAAASLTFAVLAADIATGDAISFSYNGQSCTVRVGSTNWGAEYAVQNALDWALDGSVTASFNADGHLVLTANAQPGSDTLVDGTYGQVDVAHAVTSADTPSGSVGASIEFGVVESDISRGDTISFTYNGDSYNVTASGTDYWHPTVLSALQLDIDEVVGGGQVRASFGGTNGTDLVLTAVGNSADTLDTGTFTNPLTAAATSTTVVTFGAIKAAIVAGDIISFNYSYSWGNYNATVGDIGDGSDASILAAVQTAIDAAINISTYDGSTHTLGANTVTASFSGTDLVLTSGLGAMFDGCFITPASHFASTDHAAVSAPASLTLGAVKADITTGDVIWFTYNGAGYAATVGDVGGGLQTAVQAAIDGASGGGSPLGADRIAVSFSGSDLVLTAVGGINDTLEQGMFANATFIGSTALATVTNAGASGTFSAIENDITANDTISFDYNGMTYTATVGAIADRSDASIAAAVQSAVDAASYGSGTLGAGHVAVSFSGSDLVLTAVGPNIATDTLYGDIFHNVDGIAPSDSTLSATDVITGFSLGTDQLALPNTRLLSGMFDVAATGVANLTVNSDTAANETFAAIKPGMTTGDTISFAYNGQSYTATLTHGYANLQADIDAAVGGCSTTLGSSHVAASFNGTDLVLTAAGNVLEDSLANGTFAKAGVAPVGSSPVAATMTFVGAQSVMVTGDTISFNYGSSHVHYTATLTNGVTALQADIDAAVATVDGCSTTIGSSHVAASFNGTDLVLTSADPLVMGLTTHSQAYSNDVGVGMRFAAIQSDLSSGDTIGFTYNGQAYSATLTNGAESLQYLQYAIDNAHNVTSGSGTLGANHVSASFSGTDLVLNASVGASLASGAFTNVIAASDHPAASGVVTFGGSAAATASVTDKATALLTAMGSNQYNASFVVGNDTYVVHGDGVAGVGVADIMVKLAGVQVADLGAILTSFYD